MKIIIDTNVVFSAILNTNSTLGDLLLNSQNQFTFYSVAYLKVELENHKDKLQQISSLSSDQIEVSKNLVFSRINFISEEQIPYEFWLKSIEYVREVDMDDIAFIALSLYMENTKLWTGDKKLRKGVIAKGFQNCVSTSELLNKRREIESK